MKNVLYNSLILLITIILHVGCSKEPMPIDLQNFETSKCQSIDNVSGVELYFMLVDDKNQIIDSFKLGQSVSFKYFLKNNTNNELTYMEPCNELLSLLHVYKKKDFINNQYDFIGQPNMFCVSIAKFVRLKPMTSVELKSIYLNSDITWPEMSSGSYYVGDTIRLVIADKKSIYSKRIYFKIL